jgi:hypothetical protein
MFVSKSYFFSFLFDVELDRSKYSLVIVPQLDVSVIAVGSIGGGGGDKSCDIVLANVGHKLSTLNVEWHV